VRLIHKKFRSCASATHLKVRSFSLLSSFVNASRKPGMMQHRAAFLPPLVRDLVCYDETTLSLNRQESHTHSYLNDQGLLFIDAIRPCLPQSVVTAAVATTHDAIGTGTNTSTTTATSVEPSDLYPFKIACVKVQSELLKLSKGVSIPLRELYTDSLEWLGVPGLRAAEIWFELYENQMFDQALVVGSTVLEQLVSNVSYSPAVRSLVTNMVGRD